ncbi:DedA family protein [Streptomyces antarcticus]|uniref:DedA family protein n=1 Tax=Streptomyces antarcticus TaxID=2996458 RepID=UPI00226E8AAB|nr:MULTISPECIES: VTT domain-containing protein [unclassified Streptomyces]MCY0942488.1 VTT domain-containing protein [Streptomyces sp. H34-AA3]MCY0948670.1 VTT domain-containing protein [Streptomyces sp. H27-S2]MCZ4083946.1 VTT domain-containing protein [Streptomyces sp. H34-S5]
MFETLGSLTASPWIYAVVAVSVVLDVFLPVLPSGVLVITAAAAAAAAGAAGPVPVAVPVTAEVPDILALLVIATASSVLGDMAAFRLARRGGARLDRAIARSRRLTRAQDRLGTALARGGGALVVIARFAPAGRSVVSLGAGKTHRKVMEFLPWSVLAGMAWAGYSVALGYFGTQWLGTQWLGTAVSLVALFAGGALAAYLVRRPYTARTAAAPAA